jgi:hypothetical protein
MLRRRSSASRARETASQWERPRVVEAPKTLTVKIDKTAPTVSTVDPLNYATGVVATANISATFFEESSGVDLDTIRNSTFKVVRVKSTGSVRVSGIVSYAQDSQMGTFDPSSSLTIGLYRATLTIGVKDKAANALANNYTWRFATVRASRR